MYGDACEKIGASPNSSLRVTASTLTTKPRFVQFRGRTASILNTVHLLDRVPQYDRFS